MLLHPYVATISAFFVLAHPSSYALVAVSGGAGLNSLTASQGAGGSQTGFLLNTLSAQKGSHLDMDIAVDPIPLVPLSFGLHVGTSLFSSSPNFTPAEGTSIVGSQLKWFELGLNAKAWLPLGKFAPYGRLGYMQGTLNYTGSGSASLGLPQSTAGVAFDVAYASQYQGRGPQFAVGLETKLIPFVSAFAEWSQCSMDVEVVPGSSKATYTQGQTDIVDSLSFVGQTGHLVTQTMRLGVAVGL